MLRCVDEAVPFFGSCFGHQFLGRTLGGTVIADPAAEEVGTFEVSLTADGAVDPLFEGVPTSFPAHLGHHDRIALVPPELVTLAVSERCSCQAVRVPGKPVYGTQFHAEMTERHMRERLMMYPGDYLPADDPASELDRRLRSTLEVDSLLSRFVDLYL